MAEYKPFNNETMIVDLREAEKVTGLYFVLTVIEGNDFGYVIQLDKNETVLGRKGIAQEGEPVSDVQLDDEMASRRHALFFKHQIGASNEYYVAVSDLNSKNGTYINDQRVSSDEIELKNGDKIRIGNTILKFEIKDQLDNLYQERLYQQVTRDALTGLWNHNYARQEINKLVSIGKTHQRPFSLLLIEIDFFQTLSEIYDTKVTDALLRRIGEILVKELLLYNIATRYTNRQFLVLLPETEAEAAIKVAEKLRKTIETIDFSTLGCAQTITISVGVAQFPTAGVTSDELLNKADETLYRAKKTGRNCVCVATPIPQRQPRNLGKLLKRVSLLISLLLLVGLLYMFIPRLLVPDKRLSYSGIVEVHEVEIGSKVGGRVKEILVQEGQFVKKDQPLIRFDDAELKAQQELLIARIKKATAKLTKLKNGNLPEEVAAAETAALKRQAILTAMRNGARPEEIAQAEAELNAGLAELQSAQASFARIKQVYTNGYTSRQTYDDAQSRVELAQARVENLRQKLSLLKAGNRQEDINAAEQDYQEALLKAKILRIGTRHEEIEAAQAELLEVEAELRKLQVLIDDIQVKASVDGLIEVISVRPGDIVPADKAVLRLLEENQLWVRIYAPETDLGAIHIGQPVAVKIDTFPDRSFAGQVIQISAAGEFIPRNIQTRKDREYQVFGIKIQLTDKEGVLKPGMAASVTLQIKEP
ncbi:MAG: diguanylate cyclase [Acidobacteriota bacterium]